MFVNGLGTANPPHRYSKAECWEAFKTSDWFLKLDRRAHTLAETVLLKDNGIASRSLAVASLSEVFHIDPDTLHGLVLWTSVNPVTFSAYRLATPAASIPAVMMFFFILNCLTATNSNLRQERRTGL